MRRDTLAGGLGLGLALALAAAGGTGTGAVVFSGAGRARAIWSGALAPVLGEAGGLATGSKADDAGRGSAARGAVAICAVVWLGSGAGPGAPLARSGPDVLGLAAAGFVLRARPSAGAGVVVDMLARSEKEVVLSHSEATGVGAVMDFRRRPKPNRGTTTPGTSICSVLCLCVCFGR